MSLTALILSLAMPLWAGEGDGKEEGEPAAKSVPPKAPEEGKMEEIPLGDEKGGGKSGAQDSTKKKEKKKGGGCNLL